MRARLLPLSALVAASYLCSKPAWGYERQWHAGASFGYALLSGDPPPHGLGGGLHLTYGLTDAFNAMLEIDFTAHPQADLFVASGALGVGYVIDILQWVPYVGLLAGGYDVLSVADVCGQKDAPACNAFRFGLSAPAGLDYQLSRSFAIGAQARYHLLFGGDSVGQYLTAVARAEYIWGY